MFELYAHTYQNPLTNEVAREMTKGEHTCECIHIQQRGHSSIQQVDSFMHIFNACLNCVAIFKSLKKSCKRQLCHKNRIMIPPMLHIGAKCLLLKGT